MKWFQIMMTTKMMMMAMMMMMMMPIIKVFKLLKSVQVKHQQCLTGE